MNKNSHSSSLHVYDTPLPPCTPLEQLARSLAKEVRPKPPFVFLAFPFFLAGHIKKNVYGLSVATQCSNFLLFTLGRPLLFLLFFFPLAVFTLPSRSRQIRRLKSISLGHLEEEHSCFSQDSYWKLRRHITSWQNTGLYAWTRLY